MTYHMTVNGLACDVCFCVVDPSERGRELHTKWHDLLDADVIDLTSLVEKVAS